MTIWYKQGVYGELVPEAAEGLRRVEKLFASKGQDVFVTSIRDSSHGPGSFHPHGKAWDQRPNYKVSVTAIKKAVGIKFDVVPEKDHTHIELDVR
jgi:hypothetical protein